MHIQSFNVPKSFNTVSVIQKAQKRSDLLLLIVIFVTVFSLTPLLILAGATLGFAIVLGLLAALCVVALIVRWPGLGFFVVAGCALLVEQEPLTLKEVSINVYIFYWPPSLAGLFERPFGFLLLFIFMVIVCHRLVMSQRPLRGGPLLLPFLFYLLCLAGGVLHGLTSGGDLKIIVVELRPFWYLFLSYLLAYNLVKEKKQIRNFFWLLIFSAGVKGIEGTYIYLVLLHGNLTGHREIMAHEESFFLVALILLVVLFSLHYRYRAQFYAALLTLPCLLIALIGNQRRADYIALLVGIMVAWVLVFRVKAESRKWLIAIMLICVAIGGAYVAVFWRSTGGIGEPARAVVSIFYPDPTDASSNLYRSIENVDLKATVAQSPLIGWGLGKQFLQPIPLPNILDQDPYYLYVPHNTIYWVWMRLGAVGYLAFWYLIGGIIIRGSIIVRQLRDRYLQLVAIYIVAVTFMEIIVAFADYQLFFYRNVVYLGLLVGILLKLPELNKKEEASTYEATHGITQPTMSDIRR